MCERHELSFLRQPCNKTQVNCMAIAKQSCGICGQNAWVRSLVLVVWPPCISYSSLACLVAVVRPHKIARESQGKWTWWKVSFCCCGCRATLSLRCWAKHRRTTAKTQKYVIIDRCTAAVRLMWKRLNRVFFYNLNKNENTIQQPLRGKWTGPIDKSGKFHWA